MDEKAASQRNNSDRRNASCDLDDSVILLAELEGAESADKTHRPRERGANYLYGNYPSYYSYRFKCEGRNLGRVDVRLAAIDTSLCELFGGGKGLAIEIGGAICLDIGCNSGAVTIDLVTTYKARRAIGIDIDYKLVSKAIRSIPPALKRSFTFYTCDYARPNSGGRVPACLLIKCKAIFCLSITKWIHLHGGDDAIRRTFTRCRDQLVAGGFLFLEPQEWKTYSRKKNLTPQMAANYEQISIKPDQFVSLLEREFSFRLLSSIAPAPTATRGFQRYLHILRRV